MNRNHALLTAAAVLGGIVAAGPALAMPAYATAHLNLRTGPGEQYPVVGMIVEPTARKVVYIVR